MPIILQLDWRDKRPVSWREGWLRLASPMDSRSSFSNQARAAVVQRGQVDGRCSLLRWSALLNRDDGVGRKRQPRRHS